MRGMITYIPLSVNLTTTQGCIRGLAHACVCVEEEEGGGGRGEGDVARRMCTSFCKLHFPHGYMKGLMTMGER